MANADESTSQETGDGVFCLVTRLSEILVKENNPSLSGKSLKYNVNKARSSLYGTLLGKYNVKEIAALSEKLNHMSPMSWLIAQRFVLSNSDREEESIELDDAIRQLFTLGWDDISHPILRLLVCLTNCSVLGGAKEPASYEPFCLSQKLGLTSFQTESRKQVPKRHTYPSISSDIFKPPPWMNTDHSASQSGGYVTSFPFNQKPGEGLPLLRMFGGVPLSEVSEYKLRPILPLTGPRDLTEPSKWSESNYEDEGYFTPMTEVAVRNQLASECVFEDPTKIWTEALTTTLSQLKSWETFGNLITETEPPFSSAGGPQALHHLSILVNTYHDILNTQLVCDASPIPREEFMRDVILLLSGIGSFSFPFVEESDSFVLREGMWLEGYCVDDTAKLCQDFLFCGTHFKRLERLSHLPNSLKDDGLMIQSLMGCIQRWTQFYHGAVLVLSAHFKSQGKAVRIYEMLEYVQALKQQVDCLSRLCCVDGSKESSTIPRGVALLAHIYREASKSNSQQSHLLYSALKSCCEVYLQCLQRWIFLGDCTDNKANEFFVRKDPDFYTKRDRLFWTRGFVLNKGSVPIFLQGLEVAVFDCGRAMNLLQLCSPQHPLFMLLDKKHPTIRCCLYKSDMEKVQNECTQFEKEAQKVCGDFMNVSKLLEEEKEQEAHLQILMQKAQKEREILRAKIKLKEEKERAEIRDKQNADLKAQILELQQRKAAEKEQQRIEDELYLLECRRLEDVAKLIEEEQRQKVLAHYEELGKVVDKQNQLREWQIKRLKISDKRNTFLYEDSLNLAKNLKLLDKVTPHVSFSQSSDVQLLSKENTLLASEVGEGSTDCVEPSQSSNSNIIVQDQKNVEDMCTANSTFKEASLIKAKVMQIEFGLVSKPAHDMDNTNCDNSASSSSNKLNVLDSDPSASVTTGLSSEVESHVLTPCIETGGALDRIKNRERVMTEHDCWGSNEDSVKISSGDCVQLSSEGSSKIPSEDSVKVPSEDSGIVSDLARNRQKVLSGEGIILGGLKESNVNVKGSANQSMGPLSDLQRNRRKVLGEEYNIITGEETSASQKSCNSVSFVMTTDSGIVVTASESRNFESDTAPCSEKGQSISACDGIGNNLMVFERPKMLSVGSETSSLLSPLTPHGHMGMPVFTSPFKGTDSLPNELPLVSPLLDFASEKVTCFEVKGIPLMVDIADNFALEFSSPLILDDTDSVDHTVNAEMSKTLPNTSWLESSLQTCLLLPLRAQYKYVSAALLHFFLVDLSFLTHLKSLRSYFLMQDGEFGRHLTVQLFTQMYQVPTPDKLFNSCTLDRIVKQALASSQGISDPNQNRLCLNVSSVPDHFSHLSANVLDCIQLSYKVKWPLNLLLTPDVLEKYNLIFLFLVRLKRVAWLLQEDFVALKNTARGSSKSQNRDLLNSPQYHQVQMIRHSMSQFVQATLNYVSSCVLHASWTDFAISLKQATTIDHIYNAHIEYIKRLLKRCLLNNHSKRVEAVLSKILVCINKFHSYMRVRQWYIPCKQGTNTPVYYEHPNFQQLQACSVHFKLQVSKLVNYLERLISPPNQQQHLAEYVLLLNINGFFKAADYLRHVENANNSDGKSLVSSQSISKEQL